MKFETEKVKTLLGNIYDKLQSRDDFETNSEFKREFIFHMTDWLEYLERLVELYEVGDIKKEEDKAAQQVAGFLYHVIPHLKAAGRLLLDNIPDPFE